MSKNDDFIQQECASLLKPGEQVQSTALVFQGPGILLQALLLGPLLSWLITKYYFAVLTDQRLVLIRTNRTLRLNTIARVAGQKTFTDDVAQTIRPLLTA